jgi:FtsH-binding integral membrane protein
MMIGAVTSYYSAKIVLQALVITSGVFLGLTLFTLQSKVRCLELPLFSILTLTQYDFSNMGPYLFAGLMGMLITGLVQIFLPFNKTTDLVIACFGVLLFSGYSEFYANVPTRCIDSLPIRCQPSMTLMRS